MDGKGYEVEKNYCAYYQACLSRSDTIKIVSILKSFDNVCFDRALDPQRGIFEFFVPLSQEECFNVVMSYFIKTGIVTALEKKRNRMIDNPIFVS